MANKFVKEVKKNFKQGMGDAIDTATRLPNRLVGKVGLKQAYTKTNPKNKGEMARDDLKERISSGYKAFMSKGKSVVDKKKADMKSRLKK